MTSIYLKNEPLNPSNYRPTTITSSSFKVLKTPSLSNIDLSSVKLPFKSLPVWLPLKKNQNNILYYAESIRESIDNNNTFVHAV